MAVEPYWSWVVPKETHLIQYGHSSIAANPYGVVDLVYPMK